METDLYKQVSQYFNNTKNYLRDLNIPLKMKDNLDDLSPF